MSKKLTKDDIRNPDKMTQELQIGMSWVARNFSLVAGIAILFIVSGSGYSVYSYFVNQKEEENQESFYKIERVYLDQKANFEKFDAAEKKPPVAKNTKTPEAIPADPGIKASGDLEKDYGAVTKDFSSMIQKMPDSKAARMAALTLSDIYAAYSQKEKALGELEKPSLKTDLLSALVLDRKASLKADLGDCKSALNIWDQALKIKDADFMAADIKLKKGLCFESLSDLAQAEAMYTQAKAGDTKSGEGATAKTAEKYLRLLQTKKN